MKQFCTFLILLVFQISNIQASIRLALNNPTDTIVKSVTEITITFENDSLVSADTLKDIEIYNENGLIIEENYSIGTSVLHKYLYNSKFQLYKEIRLTPKFTNDLLSTDSEIYIDTLTQIKYSLKDNGQIISASKIDMWGSIFEIIEYKYNNQNKLISKMEIDSSGNPHDFEIHKYSKDGTQKTYSIYNHELMTSTINYKYTPGESGILISSKHKFIATTITYYDKSGKNPLRHETLDKDGEIKSTLYYEYNSNGWLAGTKLYRGSSKNKILYQTIYEFTYY